MRDKHWLKRMILLAVLAGMMCVWPLCLYRRDTEERSGDEGHMVTEGLEPGQCLSQTFQATESYIRGIDFALEYVDGLPREGTIRFELLDESGKLLHGEEMSYEWLPSHTYYGVPLEMRLKKNAVYEYRVVNVDVTENLPGVIYTHDAGMDAAPDRELAVGGVPVEGAALTKYTWKAPMDPLNTLELWGFMAAVGAVAAQLGDEVRMWLGRRNPGPGDSSGERKGIV